MDKVLDIDEAARTARVQAGVYGPALEESLQARGWTLGHYPQSFEFSTLGGWIAHRGAGQQSNKYGKAEKWLVSARLATPKGLWDTEAFPASAAGPQLSQMIPGSEGIFGVITEATVRIQPKPAAMDYRGYIFADFAKGCEAVRALVQSGVPTAMIRLSDLDETYFFSALQLAGKGGPPKARFCMMIVGLEGDAASVEAALPRSRKIIEAAGGTHMGESFGESWYKNRFGSPYLRDPMMDHGLGVDTLETSTRWSNILPLHRRVTDAIAGAMAAHPGRPGAKAIVMAHVSHAYPDGASLYFTFSFARDLKDELGQWWAIKRAASDAILDGGGTISHHHGVGTDHREWAEREKGPVGVAVLKAMKAEIDPRGVLNPGKLVG
jgi:alkyldihydroxyacetonephosphate synthase